MPPTNFENALTEILEMFGQKYYNINFTADGLDALKDLCWQSLGQYFEQIEPKVTPLGRDLWRGPDLKEMPNFILGYAIPQIAISLKNVSGGKAVGADTVRLIGKSVMRDGKTEEHCAAMLASYVIKLGIPRSPTGICAGVTARKEKKRVGLFAEAGRSER